jgi:hypothetical protein
MLCAYTNEIDDVDKALSQIHSQLGTEKLLRHSVGILYYYGDFAQTGVVQKLCSQFDFPIVGGTTSNSAVPGSGEDMNLTLTILTSDDCTFSAGVSDPLSEDPFVPIEKLYRQLVEQPGASGKPALFFIMAPYLVQVAGDDYLAVLNSLSGVPVFGSAAFTHATDFGKIRTFLNGVEYNDRLVLIAFHGNLHPRFFCSTIPEDRMIHQRALITDSYRNRVRKINGIPAMQYLESVGLSENGELFGVASFPLVVYTGDGSRLIRTIFNNDGEEILCSGSMPVHTTLGISFCDKEFVVDSTKKTMQECIAEISSGGKDDRLALMISCAARRVALGSDVYAEIRAINAGWGDFPYHFAYSSGEFCPMVNLGGKTVNCFLNYSLSVCII